MTDIERVARAIRTKMGGCYHLVRNPSECADMIPGGNCECADLARAAIEAMPIDQLRAVNELRAVLVECADDLEAEINSRYKDSAGRIHPALETKYWRDMRPVCAARAALNTEGR